MNESKGPIQHVGIVGAGAMGTGIAHVSALGGISVTLIDAREGVAAAACEQITNRLNKRVADGKMPADKAAAAIACLRAGASLTELANCDLVVEAIIENIDAKLSLFTELEAIVRPGAILASNTSSIPIGEIAAGCERPERIAGLHFFNPVPLMKLVEVIPGPDTDNAVLDMLVEVSQRMGRTPVIVNDMPGFLVNYGGRAYTTEGLAIEHESVATPAQIDAIMRDCFDFRMGPFELMDLTGMDVNFPVTQFIHERFFADPRLRSTPKHRYMLETKQLGRKTGRGFYSYGEGQAAPSADAVSNVPAASAVVVLENHERLTALLTDIGVKVLTTDDRKSPILIAPIGEDCSAYISRLHPQLASSRVVAIDLLGNTDKRITLMKAPGADMNVVNAVVSAFTASRKVCVINDSPGFVGPRIAAMVANLGCEMAQTGVASIEDIDSAMRLGLNYPQGPLQLCDSLGVNNVYTILLAAQSLSGDDRYRPSQWLRRRAQLGLSARTLA
ncbi:3-hydroxyacyl-CoA dehydrogenase [Paenalcaligenes niemegkensis]|uniref:3-hydroxyacyl-CoA dehydrogenase n=1 Tax=Paenalcaligenes niemegkensis TaxID=2895469 RepID=UPI001EE94A11|nr:3-hydroxyacyl-CoA dehydrogenase [Paenalcaligenes niemegkensis]MCQ9618130.1 3-hydroxyacyl-CoA dehydrogenase [Paenalcaligenes niemegkensis]